jgi:hypothetical protein
MYQNRVMYFFILFEWILFTVPILPSSLYVRLAIIFVYYIGHVLKVQLYYARFKYYMLNNKNREDDTMNYASFVSSNENIAQSEHSE